MKFLAALALAAGIATATNTTTTTTTNTSTSTGTACNLTAIQTALNSNTTIEAQLTVAEPQCVADSGIDIFNITALPTKAQAMKCQASSACAAAINLVSSYTNINTQCDITINGTTMIYGKLISDFLSGKIGNETDSSSGSGSESASESAAAGSSTNSSSTNSTSSSHSGAPSTAVLSYVTYGAIAAIAMALR